MSANDDNYDYNSINNNFENYYDNSVNCIEIYMYYIIRRNIIY